MTALGLPLVFGGMASAAALLLGHRGSVRSRVTAATAIAVLAGFTVTAILQFGFGSFDGSYWATAAAASAGIAAISLTVLGLGLLLGRHGLGLGAVLMLFVANPLAGLATGPAWLPSRGARSASTSLSARPARPSAPTPTSTATAPRPRGSSSAAGSWPGSRWPGSPHGARKRGLNPLDDRIVAGA